MLTSFFFCLRFIGEGDTLNPICDQLADWIALGAKYVGGCCNVGSKDIARIKSTLDLIKE